jgi:hypothetical protein
LEIAFAAPAPEATAAAMTAATIVAVAPSDRTKTSAGPALVASAPARTGQSPEVAPGDPKLAQKSLHFGQVLVCYNGLMTSFSTMPNPFPAPPLGTLIDELSDRELIGLCRTSLNQIVCASDVPSGVPEPPPGQLGVLLAEIGRRTVMARLRPVGPDVVGAAEAAQVLGVSQTNLRVVSGLPEPIAKLRATSLWDGAAIRRLAAERAVQRRPPSAP